jgi:hypothetical protein
LLKRAAVAALRHVIGRARNDDAREPGHASLRSEHPHAIAAADGCNREISAFSKLSP